MPPYANTVMKSPGYKIIVALLAVALAAAPAAANPAMPPPAASAIPALVAFAGVMTFGIVTLVYLWRAPGSIRFAEEEVTITLAPGVANVSGVYTFYNPGDKAKTIDLIYPFAQADDLGTAENVTVTDEAAAAVPYAWKGDAVTFALTVPPKGRAAVAVTYEQPCKGNNFTYILTTTRSWRRPITKAAFVVRAPASLGPLKFPYKFRKAGEEGGVASYEFAREDFYPDVDLRVRWE